MAGVAVWIVFEVILVFRLRLPKGYRWRYFGHDPSRPQVGSVYIGDRLARNAPLLFAGVENGRSIARPLVVSLPIRSGGVVDLEKKLKEASICKYLRIKNDLDRFGVFSVVTVGRIAYIAPCIANPC